MYHIQKYAISFVLTYFLYLVINSINMAWIEALLSRQTTIYQVPCTHKVMLVTANTMCHLSTALMSNRVLLCLLYGTKMLLQNKPLRSCCRHRLFPNTMLRGKYKSHFLTTHQDTVL